MRILLKPDYPFLYENFANTDYPFYENPTITYVRSMKILPRPTSVL